MENTNSSSDVEALTKVISALKDLDSDIQKRTLHAAATFLGITPSLGASPQAGTHSSPRGFSFSEDRTLSAKDFLRDKAPKTDIERVACLGYYLTHYRETPHFKTIDISTLNTEAAQPKFSNAAKAVDNAAKSGLLVQAIKGSKQISAAGELFVQTLPDRVAAKASMAGVRKRKSKKSRSYVQVAS